MVPDVGFIVVAMSWEIGAADAAMPRVVVPPDRDIQEIDFAFLAGLAVVVAHHDHDIARAEDAANLLIAARARELVMMNLDWPSDHPLGWRLIYGETS